MKENEKNLNECEGGAPGAIAFGDIAGMGDITFPGELGEGEPGSGDLPLPSGKVYKQVAPFDTFLKSKKKRKNNICMKFPFDNMIDDALSHYTLQFNLYRRMLESVGVKIGDMRLIWLKEDGDYEIVKIGKLSDSILDRVLAK